MTRLSVVVPTYDRAVLLDRCLGALAAADLEDSEVVVVDDGSPDSTPDVLRRWSDRLPLRAFRQSVNAGPAAARNRGLREATGELVLFLDDDVVVPPALPRQHRDAHAGRDPLRCVLGRVEWHPSLTVTPFMHWLDRSGLQFAYDTWLRPGPVVPPYAAFYTANASLPRELVLDVGGFDERFPGPAYEDMELAFRLSGAGMTMEYDPSLIAWHARPIDLATFRRRTAMVARSTAVLRSASPEFPLDDAALQGRDRRRRERWRLAARAAVLRTDAARSEHYWAQVGHAYGSGLSEHQLDVHAVPGHDA